MKAYILTVITFWIIMRKASALDQKGTQFMVSFLKPSITTGQIYVIITADVDATVTITTPSLSGVDSKTLTAGETWKVPLSSSLRYETPFSKVKQAVGISSDHDVTVYVMDVQTKVSSGYLALPYHVLSTSYVAVTYGSATDKKGKISYPTFLILSLYDGTTVEVQYVVQSGGTCDNHATGDKLTFDLDANDVFGIDCTEDFTGTQITSNKPIAVISGHGRVAIEKNAVGHDTIQEMLLPVDHFGLNFVLIGHIGRPMGSINRIVAAFDQTEVTSSTGDIYNIHAYEFVDIDTDNTGQQCITSNYPVEVVCFGKGYMDILNGDDFMSLVPDTSMFTTDLYVDLDLALALGLTPYINVAIVVNREEYSGNMGGMHEEIQNCNYDVYTHTISTWPLTLSEGSVKFGSFLYGTYGDKYDGIGFPLRFQYAVNEESSSVVASSSTLSSSAAMLSESVMWTTSMSGTEAVTMSADFTSSVDPFTDSTADVTSSLVLFTENAVDVLSSVHISINNTTASSAYTTMGNIVDIISTNSISSDLSDQVTPYLLLTDLSVHEFSSVHEITSFDDFILTPTSFMGNTFDIISTNPISSDLSVTPYLLSTELSVHESSSVHGITSFDDVIITPTSLSSMMQTVPAVEYTPTIDSIIIGVDMSDFPFSSEGNTGTTYSLVHSGMVSSTITKSVTERTSHLISDSSTQAPISTSSNINVSPDTNISSSLPPAAATSAMTHVSVSEINPYTATTVTTFTSSTMTTAATTTANSNLSSPIVTSVSTITVTSLITQGSVSGSSKPTTTPAATKTSTHAHANLSSALILSGGYKVPGSSSCGCFCSSLPPRNSTEELLEKLKLKIHDLLLLKKWNLSKTVRRLTSARDDRASAAGFGYTGVTFLILVGLVILLSDISRYFTHKYNGWVRCGRRHGRVDTHEKRS